MRDFTVTVYDGVRGEEFEKVFGSTTVPVMDPVPSWAELPGFDEPQLVYMLDQYRVPVDAHWRLVEHLGQVFGLEKREVEEELRKKGMPILASECVADLGNIRHFL